MDSPGTPSTDIPILRTKMHKPLIRKEFVDRQTLLDALDANVHLPLTLISAATGFGKSVTASQWLENTGHRYGWVSLDEEHNEVTVFLRYLFSVMKAAFPQENFDLESLLHGTNLPSKIIGATLINDLDKLEDVFILVLDDYHKIHNEKIHEIINGLLQYPPALFHLVILTQRDPPLKLAKMRAQRRLHELRMKDLSFSKDEALDLRTRIAAKTADQQVSTLVQRTDGWVTGITAGLMVLADGVDFQRVIKAVISQNSVISELLDEVVMTGMSVPTQKFLELSVLPDRFSAELIGAMVGAIEDEDLATLSSKDFIRLSKLRNLFLIPLDANGQWYRYHHFFREQLKNRTGKHFSKDTIIRLYKAAASWYEANHSIEEALKYAIRSKDMAFAVQLFAGHRMALYNNDQIQRLSSLINLFPESSIGDHPELLLSLAALQNHSANYTRMRQYLRGAEPLLDKMRLEHLAEKKLLGEYHSLHAILAFKGGHIEQAVDHAEKAMERIPAREHHYMRELALAYFALSHLATGSMERGLQRIDQEYGNAASSDTYFKRRVLQMKCSLHLLSGNPIPLSGNGLALTALVSPKNLPGAWLMGAYAAICSAYLRNRLDQVSEFHEQLITYRYSGWPFWRMQCFFLECLSHMHQGLGHKTEECIFFCRELAEELEIEPLKGMVNAFRIEYLLKKGQVDEAIRIAPMADFNPHPPLYHYFIPQLTEVKLLFSTNQNEKGFEVLRELLEAGRRLNKVNLLVQGLALKATIHAGEANLELAEKALNEALLLSENKGLLRAYLDFGEPMHQLLCELAKAQPENDQLRELLQAFREDRSSVLKKEGDTTGGIPHELNALSIRELEVLNLVSKGLKNTEIAEKLFISLDTVKKHLYNAYQKLYVKNRVGAIKKAQDLGLLDLE